MIDKFDYEGLYFMESLILFFIIWLLSFIPILVYAFSRNKFDFKFRVFFKRNRPRFFLAILASLIFLFAISVLPVDTVSALLKPFGLVLEPGANLRGIAAAIGIFIGVSLVVGIKGDQAKGK